MSEQSIADKSQVIRQETQQHANTRGRVADVIDDINATKANKTDIVEVEGDISAHLSDFNNPHNVTKVQVGLGNADNTSDLDKPISNAVQAELDDIRTDIQGQTDWNIAQDGRLGQLELHNIEQDTAIGNKANTDASNIDTYVPQWREKLRVPELPDPTNDQQVLMFIPTESDAWRNVTLTTNPQWVQITAPFASTLNLIPNAAGREFAGVNTKFRKNGWDGKNIFLRNDSEFDLVLKPTTTTAANTTFYTFEEEQVLKAHAWKLFKIREFGGGFILVEVVLGKDINPDLFMLVSDYVQDGKIRADKIHDLSISQVTDLQNWLDLLGSAIDAEEVERAAADNLLGNRITANETAIAGKVDKPTTTSDFTAYPYIVGVNDDGNSARFVAGNFDIISAFFDSNLRYTLPNYNTPANYSTLRNSAAVAQTGQAPGSDSVSQSVDYKSNGSTLGKQWGATMNIDLSLGRDLIFNRKFAILTTVATQRMFVGLYIGGTAQTNQPLETITNHVGICMIENSNKIWFIYNNATGSAILVDTGFTNDINYAYRMMIYRDGVDVYKIKLFREHRTTYAVSISEHTMSENPIGVLYPGLWCVDSAGVEQTIIRDYGFTSQNKGYRN